MSDSSSSVPSLTPSPTEDRLYMYCSLIVQALMSISIIVIAVIRFIQNKQNTRLNTIKNIYYTNKNKVFSTSDEENPKSKG